MDGGIEIIGMQISLQECVVGGQVDYQFVNFVEGQYFVVELVIQQVIIVFVVIGNKVFVIFGDVDFLYMLWGLEVDQYFFVLVKVEYWLIVEYVGYCLVWWCLVWYGVGMGMVEMVVDVQGVEQVVRGDLLVDYFVQLLVVYWMVKGFLVLWLESGYYCEWCFLFWLGFVCVVVGVQLIDLIVEGDQFFVQFIKGVEVEIVVFQQVCDGGVVFVNFVQQGVYE